MKKIKKEKEVLKNSDADVSASLAFEELLELSTTKLSDINLNTITLDDDENTNYIDINETIDVDENDLFKIIKRAQKQKSILNNQRWVNSEENEENEIIKKAEMSGKSKYDSDVLRELILKRQRDKRKDKGLNNFIDNVKKKKNNYDK
ncbi:hypothetical protein [Spiroplasma tabanidicola]|uniref:Uncharacterized protein n=1 Tax=Spiroplasma tabanidicola TaxID=324079 RepID=A0A6I6CC93_9MOLU|nr:hypothetical protein [Spiroplasma tabanidicola]QGS51878.1 hypothetical protein STABA_v1c05150 [Spiroplasma tabanidicola]